MVDRGRMPPMACHCLRVVRCVSYLACGIAILLSPALARAAGANPETATATQKSQAQARYEQGVKAYKARHFDEAAKDFKASYEIVASPNSHMMYARALRDGGHPGQAYEEFALTQNEAGKLAIKIPRYATAAESAETEKNAVLKKVAAISVEIDGDPSAVTLYVNSRKIPHARWRAIAVKPGSVDVTARVTGGRRAWRTVTATIGKVTRVHFDISQDIEKSNAPLPPPAAHHAAEAPGPGPSDQGLASKHRLRRYAYIAGGVGAAGLLTFAIAGSMSHSTYNQLDSSCKNHVCPPAQAGNIDKGKTEQTVANVGLGVGIVGIGAGVALFVLDMQHSSPSHDSARRLDVGVGPGSVSLRGSF